MLSYSHFAHFTLSSFVAMETRCHHWTNFVWGSPLLCNNERSGGNEGVAQNEGRTEGEEQRGEGKEERREERLVLIGVVVTTRNL